MIGLKPYNLNGRKQLIVDNLIKILEQESIKGSFQVEAWMDCIEPEQVKIKKIINGALIIATPPNKIPRWCFY